MLKVIDLSFDYQDHPLLKKLTFALSEGGLLHLRGANGAGKTTLLKLIAGLYQPTRGQIYYEECPIENNLTLYQQNICYLGHKTGISPTLTLKENCLFDVHYANQNIKELAALFNLEPYMDTACGLLSAGQRRQVGLLRLWMTHARLWLLDEPLVALDDFALSLVMNKIEAHRAHGGSVLLTSHQSLPLLQSKYEEYFL